MLALRHPHEFDIFGSGFAPARYEDDGVPESIPSLRLDVWRRAFVDARPWVARCLGLTTLVPLVTASCGPWKP
jgi:hypothetical protein